MQLTHLRRLKVHQEVHSLAVIEQEYELIVLENPTQR